MTTILVTNDDGIHSPGIAALRVALAPLGQVIVIAPDRDNSAVSHSLTMNRPLKVHRLDAHTYTIDGTPTDCVAVGLKKILRSRPDLLVSGINGGANLGDDISYSGTPEKFSGILCRKIPCSTSTSPVDLAVAAFG